MVIKHLSEWTTNLNTYLADQQEHFAFIVQAQLEVGYGFDKDVDFQYCFENNIPAYDQKRRGGAIVFAKDTLTLGMIYNNREHFGFVFDRMIDDLCVYLAKQGLDAVKDNNDILIDGYKVASSTSYNFNEDYTWTYSAAQIAMNQDLEAIKHICTKPMIKIPKGLSEFGITLQQIEAWCKNWCKLNLNINVDTY